MTGWDTQDLEGIVQKRRMRGGTRRRGQRGPVVWIAIAVVALVVAGGIVFAVIQSRPKGLAALEGPAVIAPGGYNAQVGANDTVTVGLLVRNNSGEPLKLVSTRIVAPDGLTRNALTILPAGNDNTGFDLEGDLPALQPVQLGTDPATSDAIVAARYTVDCRALLASSHAVDETIFVTVELDGEQREYELTPPVLGDEQWLTAAAKRLCLDPVPTGGSSDQPLPPLPGGSPPAQ